MSFGYQFSNLLGVPYGGGCVTFTEDGNGILSAADNRAAIRDLVTHSQYTLGIECRQNIQLILLKPTGSDKSSDAYVFLIDAGGTVLYINITSLVALARMSLRKRVTAAAVSPDGKHIAFAYGNELSVWDTPSRDTHWQFARVWEQRAHSDRVNSVQWCRDSNHLLTASKDATVRVWAVKPPTPQFTPRAFVDHRTGVRFAAFDDEGRRIYSVSREGVILTWQWQASEGPSVARDIRPSRFQKKGEMMYQKKLSQKFKSETYEFDVELCPPEEEEPSCKKVKAEEKTADNLIFVEGHWVLEDKSYVPKESRVRVSAVAFHAARKLLAVGLTNGTFILMECTPPTPSVIYKLSVGHLPVTELAFNKDGEWLAVGVRDAAQLLVWEWRSETFVSRDTGDIYGIRSVALMPSGLSNPFSAKQLKESRNVMVGEASRSVMATGSMDGRIQLWDTVSGLAFTSFTDHSGPVTGLCFTNQLNAVISSSSDGTVRAFDLLKYKNFRTMRPPALDGPAPQLSCVAVDASAEIVAAGSGGSDCQIFLWALQTGKLLEAFTGHTQPVTAIAFSPNVNTPGVVASTSLDGSTRVWDIYGRAGKGGAATVLQGTCGAIALAFDPRSNNRIAVSYFAGHVAFWDVENEEIVGQIEGLRDIWVGRTSGQATTADNSRKSGESAGGKDVVAKAPFSSIAYSADGQFLICASKRSPKICIYSTEQTHLVFSFNMTHNRDIDGLLRQLNSKFMTEAGVSLQELDISEEDMSDTEKNMARIKRNSGLPGARFNEMAAKADRKKLFVWDLETSSDGKELVVATSHGVFCYALSGQSVGSLSERRHHILFSQMTSFHPAFLSEETNEANVVAAIKDANLAQALRLALSLNNLRLITETYKRISSREACLICQMIPNRLLPVMLNYIRCCLNPGTLKSVEDRDILRAATPLFQLHLTWLIQIFTTHAAGVESGRLSSGRTEDALHEDKYRVNVRSLLLMILKELQQRKDLMADLFEHNRHLLHFILVQTQ